ncbi:hypothetical protein HYO65_gp202 [Tenacibaculum phage PTm1]|uniref:Uncharacterized protein n=1 Tax=Tenacibaculum phage PTm1 TaxID=2547425 RepID=A0A5S9C162_9CAUD|nr:hypothetical protein HYO65_gp202 [Tenacibaculum phage PTm1]BBI90594.1 hypothetical protein [Tenacibaculum phage PTm1]
MSTSNLYNTIQENFNGKSVKVIDGHLTATEKKHVLAILGAGLTEGSVKKKSYWIEKTENENEYIVTVGEMGYGLIKSYGQTKKTFQKTKSKVIIKEMITGLKLIELGYKPSKWFGTIIREANKANITDDSELIELIDNIIPKTIEPFNEHVYYHKILYLIVMRKLTMFRRYLKQ